MAANKLVTCPYDEVHKCKESRLQMHITKCRLNHLNEPKFTCPFNATHVFPIQEREYHLLNCFDQAPLIRKAAQESLDKNNPFKGRTAVPSYSQPIATFDDNEEVWSADEDAEPTGYRYGQKKPPPPGAIIEPEALSKPAQRRELYASLHQRPYEDNDSTVTQPPVLPTYRQPIQQSETSRLASLQEKNTQSFSNLGLGRGRGAQASSRIAANIFAPPVNGGASNSYSSIAGSQGVGRGQPCSAAESASGGAMFNDDDDFPALGFGRGVSRNPKGNRKPGN